MRWIAITLVGLFAFVLVFCTDTGSGAQGVRNQAAETLRRNAAACRAEGKTAEAEKLLASAIEAQPTSSQIGRAHV